MRHHRPHHPAARNDHPGHKPPRTRTGLAVYAAVALAVPLALFALAHPTVVAAALGGVAAGLLARPVYRTMARRTGRPPDAVGRSAAGE